MNPSMPFPGVARTVNLMRVLFLVALMGSTAHTAAAQERLILVGLHVEKNASLQPGLEVSYASRRLLGGHPRFTLSYATTRLATALGSNGLRTDRFLIASGWHFRPRKRVDPYVQMELGYARFDREAPDLFALLDNDAAVAGLRFGIETRVHGAVGLYGNVGYSILHSSTVYPFVASIGVHVNLSRWLP